MVACTEASEGAESVEAVAEVRYPKRKMWFSKQPAKLHLVGAACNVSGQTIVHDPSQQSLREV